MPLQPIVLADAGAVAESVATTVLERLTAAPSGDFLLGCPGGRSAEPTYRALARLVAAGGVDASRLVVVMMDEYVVADASGRPSRVDPALSWSCRGFAERHILAPLAAAARAAGTPAPSRIWVPDPADPAGYDDRIQAAGGIDLFLLASGASDGHIAFNQPGTERGSRSHVTPLGEATRRDNMSTFPELTRLELVPTHGVTVGVDTIASQSREVVMIVTGAHKHEAFERIARADAYEPDWPATIVVECKNPVVVADRAAAGATADA